MLFLELLSFRHLTRVSSSRWQPWRVSLLEWCNFKSRFSKYSISVLWGAISIVAGWQWWMLAAYSRVSACRDSLMFRVTLHAENCRQIIASPQLIIATAASCIAGNNSMLRAITCKWSTYILGLAVIAFKLDLEGAPCLVLHGSRKVKRRKCTLDKWKLGFVCCQFRHRYTQCLGKNLSCKFACACRVFGMRVLHKHSQSYKPTYAGSPQLPNLWGVSDLVHCREDYLCIVCQLGYF